MQVYRAVGTDAHRHTHQPWPAATRQRVAEHGTTDQATAGWEPWWDGGTTDGVGAATGTWSSVCATYFCATYFFSIVGDLSQCINTLNQFSIQSRGQPEHVAVPQQHENECGACVAESIHRTVLREPLDTSRPAKFHLRIKHATRLLENHVCL
jgi:hypothetical protein